MGSHFDEPIFWADLLVKGRHTDVGVLMEQSLVGEAYVTNFRKACQQRGIRIVAEATIAQTAQDVSQAVRTLYDAKAQAIARGLWLRRRIRQPCTGRARLGSVALRRDRIRERADQPGDLERVHGVDGHRPVRRGQSGGPAVP
jgi:hypothetical protein